MTTEKTERGRRRRRRTSSAHALAQGGRGNTSGGPANSHPQGTDRPGTERRPDNQQPGPPNNPNSAGPPGGQGDQRSRPFNPGHPHKQGQRPAGRPLTRRGPGQPGSGGRPGGGRPGQRANGGRPRQQGAARGYGRPREEALRRLFEELQRGTSIDPHERWTLERKDGNFTTRVIDLLAPLGRGQRCLIVAPPKAGKTTLLLEICKSLAENHPDVLVFALLVNERPEEVTHFRRSSHAEVIAASSDQTAQQHVATTENALERIVTPVGQGKDVVMLLDSITRLARAYNTVQGDSGRTLSGGLDANTMQMPRRLFGAARKLEEGGSLTILGTALIDTGSRMDEVIFQEFKGTGNTEIVLSRQLFEKRIFPAVDIGKTGTRKEEKLFAPHQVEQIHKMRRVLASMSPDRAMEGLLKMMAKYPTNDELLSALPA
jgi:transcription termination factor Rho